MKKIIVFSMFLILAFNLIYSQTIKDFNYPMVIRTAYGKPVVSQQVNIRLTVIQGIHRDSVAYSEIILDSTNVDGLISISIGNGQPLHGEIKALNVNNPYSFLKIEVSTDGGKDFKNFKIIKLLNAPVSETPRSTNFVGKKIMDKSDLLVLDGNRDKAITEVKALADFKINKIKKALKLTNLNINELYPLYDQSCKHVVAYDVKLVDDSGKAKGYLIVNLNKKELPFPEFTTEGLSITEQYRKKIGHSNFFLVWVNPTFSMALGKKGDILYSMGSAPTVNKSHDNIKSKISDKVYLNTLKDFQQKWCIQHTKAINKAWTDLSSFSGGGSTSDVVQVTQPSGDYQISYAAGYENEPHYKQIDPNTGANNKSYHSGCGATAWATLIAWHDLNWTPNLLRGSQITNGNPWGNPSENTWSTYIDRVMMELGETQYLDNHDCFWVSGNGGIVHDSEMKYGFDYIFDELEHNYSGKKTGDDDLQQVYNAIALDQRPIIIKTPNHFCVAAGFWCDMAGDNHYMLLNTGWGFPDKWIESEYLEQYWYLTDISPGITTYVPNSDIQSNSIPILCTTKSSNNLNDILWVFWLNSEGKIKYVKTSEGETPFFWLTELSEINVITDKVIFPPSVCADPDSKQLYLMYVDETYTMHLLRWEGPEKGWNSLLFPSNLKTYARPAILGRQGNWFTVAFSNEDGVQVMSTCRDLQRETPNPWPGDWGYCSAGTDSCYWQQVSPFQTIQSLSMVAYNDITVLAFADPRTYVTDMGFRLGKLNGTKVEYVYPNQYRGLKNLNLVVSNKTLFATYHGGYDEMFVNKLEAYLTHTTRVRGFTDTVPANVTISHIADIHETCQGEPYLGFTELESGAHTQLVLSWIPKLPFPNLGMMSPIAVWLLSVDTPGKFLNYTGKPY